MRRVYIVPVGTSLLDGNGTTWPKPCDVLNLLGGRECDFAAGSQEVKCLKLPASGTWPAFMGAGKLWRTLIQCDSSKAGGNDDPFPAELSHLLCSDFAQVSDTHVYLLSSDTNNGFVCAAAIHLYLSLDPDGNKEWKTARENIGCVKSRLLRMEGLDVTNPAKFLQGTKALAAAIEKIRSDHKDDDIRVCVTGGWKGSIPYTTIMAMCLGGVKLEYLFEGSGVVIEIPTLPVAFDAAAWRDNRGWLAHLDDIELEHRAAFLRILPSSLQSLYDDKGNPAFLTQALISKYQESREAGLFGRGMQLLDLIKDKDLQDKMKDNVARWQHAWVGDQVPEMVEHGRGHTQRILELAGQVLYPLLAQHPQFFSDYELAALICAIWLHDCGHAGTSFKHTFNGEEKVVNVHGLPTVIRDFHHLLAGAILDREKEALENGGDGIYFSAGFPPVIVEAAAWISRYHRKAMRIDETANCYTPMNEPSRILPCVPQISINEYVPESISGVNGSEIRVRALTALYRVLDGSDYQAERSGSTGYIEARRNALREEVRGLMARLKRSACPSQVRDLQERLLAFADTFVATGTDLDKTALDKFDGELAPLDQMARELAVAAAMDISADAALETWVRLASETLFTVRQPFHFAKHAGVESIALIPKWEDDASTLCYQPHAYYKDVHANDAGNALSDIHEEYDSGKDALKDLKHNHATYSIEFCDGVKKEIEAPGAAS